MIERRKRTTVAEMPALVTAPSVKYVPLTNTGAVITYTRIGHKK